MNLFLYHNKQTQGSILILGLLIMAVLLLIGGVFLSLTTTNYLLLTVDTEKQASFWLANAGISQAVHDLRRNYFNNEQRIFQNKLEKGMFRVGVITLRERGIHDVLITSLGVSTDTPDKLIKDFGTIPSTYQIYSITCELSIASPTDYLIFSNGNTIIGADPASQYHGYLYYGPVHSNGKIFLTGGLKYPTTPETYRCDVIKPDTILGPAISSADIIFREKPGYYQLNSQGDLVFWNYYWITPYVTWDGTTGEGDINIGTGIVSFNVDKFTHNINYEKKFNLMDYPRFALSYKNGLPKDGMHDSGDSADPSDPEYAGGITPEDTLDGLLQDKDHGGFYIQTPGSSEIDKYYKPLIDKKWHLTEANTNSLPKRVFANGVIRKKHILGTYATSNNYNNYGLLDKVEIGTGNGVTRDFSFYLLNFFTGWDQYDIRRASLKSVIIDATEYSIDQGAWEWGNVTAGGYIGVCAFEKIPANSDTIYLGIQGRWRLGYGYQYSASDPRITHWYVYPLAGDTPASGPEPAWFPKQARRIDKVKLKIVDYYRPTLYDATAAPAELEGPYTVSFYRWDSSSNSEKMLYEDAIFPAVGSTPTNLIVVNQNTKTIYADMIEIINGANGVPAVVNIGGTNYSVEVSVQFNNGEVSADLKPVDKPNQDINSKNDCKNEVIVPVGKGGLNDIRVPKGINEYDVSRALNSGPGQEVPAGDDGNGYYLFWSPYGAYNPAIGAPDGNSWRTEAANQIAYGRNKYSVNWIYHNITQLISVYVQKNSTGSLIQCPYLIVRDGAGIERGIIRFSSAPSSGKKIKIYPLTGVYHSLNSDGSGMQVYYTNVLPGRYYNVNPFSGSINTTSNSIVGLPHPGSTTAVAPNSLIGTEVKVEAYELDLGLIGTDYPDFPIDSQYADGWYDYNYNGKRDADEDVYGIIYSEVPLIVKGTPKKPVTIICTEDMYVKSINEEYSDDSLSANPVGLISSKAIWLGTWVGDVPGRDAFQDVILNRVSLYTQGSGVYFFGGLNKSAKLKIIGSMYFGGLYFGNYYIAEHPDKLGNATYSYGNYTMDPVSGYSLVDRWKVPYVYATSFRGSIDNKDYRNSPPPNMPVDLKVIRKKEGAIDNVQTFLSQLVEHEKSQKIVTKDIYFDFIKR